MIKYVRETTVGVTPGTSGAPLRPRCHICRKPTTDCMGPDPLAWDCGGDCVECMAQSGDIDCQRTVNLLRPGTYVIEGVSPFDTIQELVQRDRHYPWRVLVVCTLLNMTHGRGVRPMIEQFFRRVPDPETMTTRRLADVEDLLAPLGFKNRRFMTLQRMSEDYMGNLRYVEIYGVGPYALDSIMLFVEGRTDELRSNDTWLKPYRQWRLDGGPAVEWDCEGHLRWRRGDR